jgi:hypothetical protein
VTLSKETCQKKLIFSNIKTFLGKYIPEKEEKRIFWIENYFSKTLFVQISKLESH